MSDIVIIVGMFLAFAMGGLLGYVLTKRHYVLILTATKKAHVLSEDEKQAMKNSNQAVVKLDFPALLDDMESKYRLWGGSKYAVRIGIWINWIKAILAKSINTDK